MICPNCKKENKNTNIRCESCSTQLIDISEHINASDSPIVKSKEISISTKKVGCISNIALLIFIGPWLLLGISFLIVGLFSSISEHNQTKGYEKTVGTLKDYTNCTYEDGSERCEAIYEYEVNGIIYSVSPNKISNQSGFTENDTVYYNPENPSESIIYARWNSLTIIGFIFVIVIIIIFIVKHVVIKKISKGKENITMQVYNTN